jgi:hypothetical protein
MTEEIKMSHIQAGIRYAGYENAMQPMVFVVVPKRDPIWFDRSGNIIGTGHLDHHDRDIKHEIAKLNKIIKESAA